MAKAKKFLLLAASFLLIALIINYGILVGAGEKCISYWRCHYHFCNGTWICESATPSCPGGGNCMCAHIFCSCDPAGCYCTQSPE